MQYFVNYSSTGEVHPVIEWDKTTGVPRILEPIARKRTVPADVISADYVVVTNVELSRPTLGVE